MAKIAMVAGEASGDLLGYHLIKALQEKSPNLELMGIGGQKMISLGFRSYHPIEQLSVRGYLEVIKHLWALIKLRKALLKSIIEVSPDVFVGIDAPDFNLWLEKKLKARGIPSIHYVSPSIWAWRGGRIKGIKRAVTHMLALFPFEAALYQQAAIPVTYVGHPLADAFPLHPKVLEVRDKLKIKNGTVVITMLPGSRQSEVKQHAQLLIDTAIELYKHYQKQNITTQFLVPLITRETRHIFEVAWHNTSIQHSDIPIDLQIMFGHSHEAITAADAVIVASGTATLEAALLKKPMVITYRMSNLSWYTLKRKLYLPYVGLPNILANEFIAPELLQYDATPQKISEALLALLSEKERLKYIHQQYVAMHKSLRQSSAQKAAQVVLSYLK